MKKGVNQGNFALGEQDLILQLASRHAFAEGKQQHGNKGRGQPGNATDGGSRMRATEQGVEQLRQEEEGKQDRESIKALKTSGVRGKQAICEGGRRGYAVPPWKGVGAVAPHLPHARSARCQ